MQKYLDQYTHLNVIRDCTFKVGGLTFNQQTFNQGSITLNEALQSDPAFTKLIEEHRLAHNPIITDVGRPVEVSMGTVSKWPITVSPITIPNCHSDLSASLSSGVIDMWCKVPGSSTITVPAELECITPLLTKAWQFEQHLNPNAINFNMWLLVDIRPIKQYHSQRNPGYHYDGFKVSGFHKGKGNTSIYSWCNKLPTRFYKGVIEFPDDFTSNCNANVLAQQQVKDPRYVIDTEPNTLYRFDGTTVHTGLDSDTEINDRVFVRICFTPPDVFFSREGNTVNPFMEYPKTWVWRTVTDPSITFKNLVTFTEPLECKNLWDVACQGHPAFSVQHEGIHALEHQLIQYLKLNFGPSFVKRVVELYEREGTPLASIRAATLLSKYNN